METAAARPFAALCHTLYTPENLLSFSIAFLNIQTVNAEIGNYPFNTKPFLSDICQKHKGKA